MGNACYNSEYGSHREDVVKVGHDIICIVEADVNR
jgi:hypothetical protein